MTRPRRLPTSSLLRTTPDIERREIGVFPGFPQGVTARNLSGINVTEKSALTLTAAFACINVLATDLACLPMCIRQRVTDGAIDRPDHPADALIRVSPDGATTSMRLRQAHYGHVFGWGNAYLRIHRNVFGRPSELELLTPEDTQPRRRRADNGLFYSSGGEAISARDVIHLAGLGPDGLSGYSPVRLARQALALALVAEQAGAAVFANGLNHRGVLKYAGEMSDEAWMRLRTKLEEVHSGVENSARVLLLENGVEWADTSMSPEDAQLLALRAFQVVEVCRIYRVPPHKLMDYSQSGSAYRALEESNLDYVNTTLGPWCAQIEQVHNLRLLTPEERANGYYVEHSLAALQRGDSGARARYYTALFNLGVLSPNQISRSEGFNGIGPDGDRRAIPANYVPFDSIFGAGASGGSNAAASTN